MTKTTFFLAMIAPRSGRPATILARFRCPAAAQEAVDAFLDTRDNWTGWTEPYEMNLR